MPDLPMVRAVRCQLGARALVRVLDPGKKLAGGRGGGGEEGYEPARFDQVDLPFSLHVGQ